MRKKTTVSLLALVFIFHSLAAPAVASVQTQPGATQQPTDTAPQETLRIPAEQLDSLVAPIALYPDPLLSQTLVASTYPLELVQLQQWLGKNPGLQQKDLVKEVSKQPWDPSIQAMAALPDVVKRLCDDIQWTTDLGNAFLAQESDVMQAVQRMRQKAQSAGVLKSNEQQKVETREVENKTVVVVEQADPEVIYVPSYDPAYVWGEPFYPYPPIYYPAAGAIAFGIGMAIGAAWGGGWGWGCGWGGNDITVNPHNNFNRNTNIRGGDRTNIGGNRGSGKWQHNPQHRGGAPYGDRTTANRFGGTARGDSLANRQQGARQEIGRQGGNLSDRGGGDRGGGGKRGCGGSIGGKDRGSGLSGGDRVGDRSIPKDSGKKGGGFEGGSRGWSGGGEKARSSRGSSSMGGFGGSRGGGGFSRGGGGGFRGGGGRR